MACEMMLPAFNDECVCIDHLPVGSGDIMSLWGWHVESGAASIIAVARNEYNVE